MTTLSSQKISAHLEKLIADARAKAALLRPLPDLPNLTNLPKKEEKEEIIILEGKAAEIAEEEELALLDKDHKGPLRQVTKTIVDLTEEQEIAVSFGLSGKSFCLIGAAGTGKTTTVRILVQRMRDAGLIGPLSQSTKWLVAGLPGVVVLSYTNKAVANIKRGMPKDVSCITAHKLIEFEPHFYEVQNAQGEWIKTMRFEPNRNRYNKLPGTLHVVAFEESSTISVELMAQIVEGLKGGEQFIFLGDLNQLPPVYGQAILGFKLLDLPVVELTKVQRQAEMSRVLAFAWKILEGKPLTIAQISESFDKEGEFKIRPWKKRLTADDATHIATLLMNQFIDSGEFKPLEDMILIPYNKSFGTIEINRSIAQRLGTMRKAKVWEIIAGFAKYYYAVGDKVLVNKQEALIEKISFNADYSGKAPLEASEKLNRWGHYNFDTREQAKDELGQMTLEQMEELMLATSMNSGEIDEKKNQGSHILHCRFLDSDEEIDVRTTGEFAETSFAYALTVHKAQGSEWKRVILLLHNEHNKMICRELLYTAVTRARESLYIICEPDHFQKGIVRQRIKGNTLAEKAEFFKGKVLEAQEILKGEEE